MATTADVLNFDKKGFKQSVQRIGMRFIIDLVEGVYYCNNPYEADSFNLEADGKIKTILSACPDKTKAIYDIVHQVRKDFENERKDTLTSQSMLWADTVIELTLANGSIMPCRMALDFEYNEGKKKFTHAYGTLHRYNGSFIPNNPEECVSMFVESTAVEGIV